VTESQAGVSGPCPKCGTWIDASQFQPTDAPLHVLSVGLPVRSDSAKHRKQTVTSGKGSVRADGYLDHDHTERREMFATLRILAVSLAVIAVILFVTLYMKDWMSK